MSEDAYTLEQIWGDLETFKERIKSRQGDNRHYRADEAAHLLRKIKAIKFEIKKIEERKGNEYVADVKNELQNTIWPSFFRILLDMEPINFDVWWEKSK